MDYFTIFIILLLLLIICKSNEYFNIDLNYKNNASKLENFNNNNLKITIYYTDWCGISTTYIQNIWPSVVEKCQQENIITEMVNCECENEQTTCENKTLCDNKNIRGYPTIILTNGERESEYFGDRNDVTTMINTLINMN